jgi:hypothetical protein
LILGLGLSLDPILVGDTLQKKPVVLKQNPGPGENMTPGDVVELWIGAQGTPPPGD